MNPGEFSHAPVLQREVIEQMNIRADGLYVDGTFGRGGHAREILQRLGEQGRLIVMDKDPEAILCAKDLFGDDLRVTIFHDGYEHLSTLLGELNLNEQVDGVLLDLGVSSPQLDDATRGFSFQKPGPLDMRMNPQRGESAAEWLRRADESEIAGVLWELGEERYSRRIARKIVETRELHPIEDTAQLASLVAGCIPRREKNKHPATRSFQAIRIYINRELDHLTTLLHSIFDILKTGGRLLVISFHSLEDRIVKRFFKAQSSRPKLPRGLPLTESQLSDGIRLKVIGKAIRAGATELAQNTRARSAVLRVAERVV